MDTLERWLICARAPGLLARHVEASADRLGDPLALTEARASALAELDLPEAALRWLRSPDRGQVDADRRWLERSGVRLIGCSGSDFPPLLATIEDAPACFPNFPLLALPRVISVLSVLRWIIIVSIE